MQEPHWADAPPQSLDGDVDLDLDEDKLEDIEPLRAHLLDLQHASALFTDVLASCSSSQQQQPHKPGGSGDETPTFKRQRLACKLQLPLPGTLENQALLLLHCLYQHTQPAWADPLEVPELLDLARVAHKFACAAVLQQADRLLVAAVKAEEALVAERPQCKQLAAQAEAWLTPRNAPARLAFAQDLTLPGLAVHVGAFMALHADEVDLTAVDGALLGVLRGARQLCERPAGSRSYMRVA